ncbi:MAG TPA: hypothetical protein VNG51_29315 [Ktedonobacteraceae bacterium]|nr:hypothetical protein [Ktedonobacteraceae bacterium]
MKTAVDQTEKEVLTTSQRWGELVIVIPMLLVFGFFVNHQIANTGFFTAKFGILEMFCLYGPIFFSLVAPTVRALNGRRNPGRTYEVAANVFIAITALWLLMVFPFDFSHLADILPAAIRFVLAWITNDIGKVVLILQVIVGLITAFVTMGKYLSVRRRESANPSSQQTL